MSINIAILGPGNIARRFADAVVNCTGIKLLGVASRDLEKATEFANKYGIEKAYGSYQEVFDDKTIDAVYISTLHSVHYEQIMASLNAGKHVLCEKPSLLTVKEADAVIALAKEKNLLFMEAMWTRLLPPVLKAQKWIADGEIGDLKLINVAFGFPAKEDPNSRLFSPEKAGGALYDVGVYTFAFATFMANSPIKEYKTMVTKAFTGVDESNTAMIKFENKAIANICSSVRANLNDTAYIYGTDGQIIVDRFWCSTKVTLKKRGLEDEVFESDYTDTYIGFKYEIQHFADLVNAGITESPIVTYDYVKDCVKFFEDSLAEIKN
ncbi:MAG: Gfo/Idh/MocA family oxidoreductase [Clostridia bacterium]